MSNIGTVASRGSPSAMSSRKGLFSDLGKATLRGIRKCPKCGTYNGTRGVRCKNKACDAVFRERGARKRAADAVRLHAPGQLYSVRLQRGEARTFVQLSAEGRAQCEGCQGASGCAHVQAALRCVVQAQALPLKDSVVEAQEESVRDAIWELAATEGPPLVQRVSKAVLVARSRQGGFVHVRVSPRRELRCGDCGGKGASQNCVHSYACMCALTSADKLRVVAPKHPEPSLSFLQWLAGVTERINQTMRYDRPGRPDPLVFHVPHQFFECLQQRICGRRQPTRKDGAKCSWSITNLLHVRHIFETPDVPLEESRTFVENRDGTFEPYEPPCLSQELHSEGVPVIRPLELKTFLKVGNPPQSVPFIIEWTPDVLPRSRVGELRLKFEYGHLRNGLIDIRS
ncbi:uncharacterized protein C2orf42-like [Rhipicephalus sanguineus]|uniref:uncharacterized protein C2orf42-like n=1 Tax=Rhipicephalus sanguineus TaxID=34632 RepID=UPI0018938B6A|nr:uncharacterized protein C2orf42-like [Rhipicephalus sanguineus]